MATMNQISPKERGQSMVEMALAFILLMALIGGIADLGRAFFVYSALRDAAQEGASYGSLFPAEDTPIIARVRNSSSSPVDLTDAAILVAVSRDGPACQGTGITVAVTYDDFEFIMPWLDLFIGVNTIDLTASVTDTVLRPPCD
jgi:hypothetical protein